MNTLKALGFSALLAVPATASQAAVIYADSVDSYTQGVGISDPDRTIQSKALGMADGKFLTLGIGGEAIFSFGQMFKADGAIVEVTYGKRSSAVESVDVWGGLGGVFTLLGTISNGMAVNLFNFGGVFDQLKLVDMTAFMLGRDGYEIDSISVSEIVSEIPVPATGLMLLSALGLGSMLRRRKA